MGVGSECNIYYLKHFKHKYRAIIANILGPFPKGLEVHKFAAFKHSNAKDILVNTTGPHIYHYQWTHKHALSPFYNGRFDYIGHYDGKNLHPMPDCLS